MYPLSNKKNLFSAKSQSPCGKFSLYFVALSRCWPAPSHYLWQATSTGPRKKFVKYIYSSFEIYYHITPCSYFCKHRFSSSPLPCHVMSGHTGKYGKSINCILWMSFFFNICFSFFFIFFLGSSHKTFDLYK